MPIFATELACWIQQLIIPPPTIHYSINECRNFYWDPSLHELQVPQSRRVVDKGHLTEMLVVLVSLRYILAQISLLRLLNRASNTFMDLDC